MKKRFIPLVFDTEEFWESECPSLLSFPENHKTIFIARPVDDPIEAARLYKLNHNPERANAEWKWLDNLCSKVYTQYCKLWEIF